MRKFASYAIVFGLLFAVIGCPPPSSTPSTPPPGDGTKSGPDGGGGVKVNLSHVKVGQKYTYALQGGTEQVYQVKEITADAVKYDVSTVVGGKTVGDPTPNTWQIPRPTAAPTGPPVAPPPNTPPTTRENVTVSGIQFDCLVTTSGTTKSWTSMSGDIPVFPSMIKTMTGADVTMELKSITGG